MSHNVTLAKIITWAFENDIEITVKGFKPTDGLKMQIEIILSKNGAKKLIRLLDFEELDNSFIQRLVEKTAFELCLTRLIL